MSLQIINHPRSVIHYLEPEGGIFEKEYLADRAKRLKAIASPMSRVLCHHVDVNFMEAMPDLMIQAGSGLLKQPRVRDRMAKHPFLAAQMLLSSYDEAQPLLERIVLGSGEATVPLLLAIDEGKIVPARRRDEIERALLNQPWWALRYLYSPTLSPEVHRHRARFTSELKDHCGAKRNSEPQAALVYLVLDPIAYPSDYSELLCSDPMVAYLASHLFVARDFEIKVAQVQNLDARWATHIALWGAFSGGNIDDRIEPAICGSSAWTGEYIARNEGRHKDWGWVKSLYERTDAHTKSGQTKDPDLWADLLWAMLDRICLRIEGKDGRITFKQSFLRHGPPPTNAVSASSAA
jgi:hypothetical protein